MIDKKEFKKMAKKILQSDKPVQNPKLMHPAREWGVGILTGLVILAGSAIWSANTYISYRNGASISGSAPDGEVVVYRASLVEAALKTYADRTIKYESLIGNNSVPTEEIPVESDDETFAPIAEDLDSGEGLEPEPKTEPESDIAPENQTNNEEDGVTETPQQDVSSGPIQVN
jgi:hypothetical protein